MVQHYVVVAVEVELRLSAIDLFVGLGNIAWLRRAAVPEMIVVQMCSQKMGHYT